MAIINHDFGRILELTDPHGYQQITRMAIHNDMFLALLAPLYFINNTPSTLVVVQTIVLALGAVALYKIVRFIFKDVPLLAIVFAIAYLLYTPMERANIFDFHAVTFATTFLLFMFYFWLTKKYKLSALFFVLALLTKEEIPFITSFFALYALVQGHKEKGLNIFQHPKDFVKDLWYALVHSVRKDKKNSGFAISILVVSFAWFILSMFYIIPLFRNGQEHFALEYYSDYEGGQDFLRHFAHIDTLRYFYFLMGPLGFLSLLDPLSLAISAPEFGINLFSSNNNMRNIIYQYTSALQPWIFIAAVYGTKKTIEFISRKTKISSGKLVLAVGAYILICSVGFSYFKGPLPYSREKDVAAFNPQNTSYKDVAMWAAQLNNDDTKVATTGHVNPYFASRRYIYTLPYYDKADYVVVQKSEVVSGWQSDLDKPAYEKLTHDSLYIQIYNKNDIEVYKKVIQLHL
jgi:uncharacterized membrane protein